MHDTLVVEVFYGGDDGSNNVGGIPVCQRLHNKARC